MPARLGTIVDRLEQLEVQMRGLVTRSTVEAREFLVRDERGLIRARLEMEEIAPVLTSLTRSGRSA